MTVDKIMRVLAGEDLIELISAGCPADEYRPEAVALAETLPEVDGRQQVADAVQATFESYFSADIFARAVADADGQAKFVRIVDQLVDMTGEPAQV